MRGLTAIHPPWSPGDQDPQRLPSPPDFSAPGDKEAQAWCGHVSGRNHASTSLSLFLPPVHPPICSAGRSWAKGRRATGSVRRCPAPTGGGGRRGGVDYICTCCTHAPEACPHLLPSQTGHCGPEMDREAWVPGQTRPRPHRPAAPNSLPFRDPLEACSLARPVLLRGVQPQPTGTQLWDCSGF